MLNGTGKHTHSLRATSQEQLLTCYITTLQSRLFFLVPNFYLKTEVSPAILNTLIQMYFNLDF